MQQQQRLPPDVYAQQPAYWPTGFRLLTVEEKMARQNMLMKPVEMSSSDRFSVVTDLMDVTVYEVLVKG